MSEDKRSVWDLIREKVGVAKQIKEYPTGEVYPTEETKLPESKEHPPITIEALVKSAKEMLEPEKIGETAEVKRPPEPSSQPETSEIIPPENKPKIEEAEDVELPELPEKPEPRDPNSLKLECLSDKGILTKKRLKITKTTIKPRTKAEVVERYPDGKPKRIKAGQPRGKVTRIIGHRIRYYYEGKEIAEKTHISASYREPDEPAFKLKVHDQALLDRLATENDCVFWR